MSSLSPRAARRHLVSGSP